MATDKQRALLGRLTLSSAFTQAEVDDLDARPMTVEEAEDKIDWCLARLKQHDQRKRDAKARQRAWSNSK